MYYKRDIITRYAKVFHSELTYKLRRVKLNGVDDFVKIKENIRILAIKNS